MKIRLLNLVEVLRSNFWFIPTSMSLASAILAFVAINQDYGQQPYWTIWIWSGGPEGAREVLSVIASSMITVAGVVFSITIVALAQTATQYGPRLLNRFMRDLGDQVVLGTFVSTYLYCVLVLRMVQNGSDQQFVPDLSVSIAILFAVASVCVLIYFIHHVSASIHVENVTSYVAQSLLAAIDEMYPGKEVTLKDTAPVPLPPEEQGEILVSRTNGYIQGIENDKLLSLAHKHDLMVFLLQHAGNFVHEGMPLARVWASSPLSKNLHQQLAGAFLIGGSRTPTQDVDFSLHQLVEIAVRALSTSLNDPYTAITCLDWVGAALARLAKRDFPSRYRCDDDGKLRLVLQLENFPHIMQTALQPIRHYGKNSPAVLLRLMKIIASLKEDVVRPEDFRSVLDNATATWQTAAELPSSGLKEELHKVYATLIADTRQAG